MAYSRSVMSVVGIATLGFVLTGCFDKKGSYPVTNQDNTDKSIAKPVAKAIDCDSLPTWSKAYDGKKVNLHHVFCGEPGKGTSAKGFHSMPGGMTPSVLVSSQPQDGPNASGIYTLRKVKLSYNGETFTKSFSSMFPDHCSAMQVTHSIAYASNNATGNCSSPNWAQCGPSSPAKTKTDKFCVGDNGKPFTIATAVLPRDKSKINTGFPIF